MKVSKGQILAKLILNPEKASAFWNGKEFVLKSSQALKKVSKYTNTYKPNETEEKYLHVLKSNPNQIKLEYSLMGYFILVSRIEIKKLNLLENMKMFKGGLTDQESTLNIIYEKEEDGFNE